MSCTIFIKTPEKNNVISNKFQLRAFSTDIVCICDLQLNIISFEISYLMDARFLVHMLKQRSSSFRPCSAKVLRFFQTKVSLSFNLSFKVSSEVVFVFRSCSTIMFTCLLNVCLLSMKYQQTSMTLGFCYPLPVII